MTLEEQLGYKILYPVRYVKSDRVVTDMNDKLLFDFDNSTLSENDINIMGQEIVKLLNTSNYINSKRS